VKELSVELKAQQESCRHLSEVISRQEIRNKELEEKNKQLKTNARALKHSISI